MKSSQIARLHYRRESETKQLTKETKKTVK